MTTQHFRPPLYSREAEPGGTIECPICGLNRLHTHTEWEIERERYCRPKFEEFFAFNLASRPHGLDLAGTYGWAFNDHWSLRWRHGDVINENYHYPQVQVIWEAWQAVWFLKKLHSCKNRRK